MAIDTTKKIKQVTYNGVEIPLRGYDTSDATVKAGDMAKGVVAYGKNGRVVGDIVKSALPSNQMSPASTSIETSDGQIWFKGNFDEGTVIASKSRIGTYLDFLGDATAADVAKGKTFTSAAGLRVVGTAEASAGYKVTFPATATNWNEIYGDYSGLLMTDGTIKPITDYSTLAGKTFENVVGIRCYGSSYYHVLKMTLSSGTIAQTNVAVQTTAGSSFTITTSPNTTPTYYSSGRYTFWWPLTDVVISAIEMYNTD